VTWTNRDEEAHTVAFSGMPVSQPLQNGDTYTHTFGQAGTYSYICSIHPFMRGMVVVTAG
jgi:plastocyanin